MRETAANPRLATGVRSPCSEPVWGRPPPSTPSTFVRRISDLLVAAGEQEDLRPFFAPRERGRALGFSAIPMSQNGHVLGHDYEFALNFSSGSADLLVVVCISHKVAKPDGTFRWLVPCPENRRLRFSAGLSAPGSRPADAGFERCPAWVAKRDERIRNRAGDFRSGRLPGSKLWRFPTSLERKVRKASTVARQHIKNPPAGRLRVPSGQSRPCRSL